jgi:hypothetical protein
MRRILWNIYAWPVTLMLLSGDFWAGCHYKGAYIIIFAVLDFLISFPSVVAMHLHIWDKKLFNPSFWKTYAFAYCAWDFSFNVLIVPAITGEKFAPSNLIGLIILLPFYVALFRYAFRQWKVNEERIEIPNQMRCCRRILIVTVTSIALGMMVLALFYAEEDWRGKHDWEKFKLEWEAKGEKFDMAGVTPPPVPDDQNFALTPIVFTSYGSMLTRDGKVIPRKDRDTNFVDWLKMRVAYNDDWPATNGNWQTAKISDLKVWQNYYRALAAKTNEFPISSQPQTPAQDVLLALSKYDSTIEELRQASQLPYSRFPLEYDKANPADILLPHLGDLKRCSQVLQLRALAELQNGESEKALDDVKLSLRLADSIRTEPFLISQLVRVAILQITLQPVYEGLAAHKWSDTQLAELDSELSKLDFLADCELSMRGERAGDIGIIEYLRHLRTSQRIPDIFYSIRHNEYGITTGELLIFYFGPGGWNDQSELQISQLIQHYVSIANVDLQILSPTSVSNADAAVNVKIEHSTPFNPMERILLPALGAAAKKFAYAQSSTDLAHMAVALERYRLAHGEFPESLDALAPQLIAQIPHDIINGQPLHYHRTDDGQFVLYSVGWNETDDGGQTAYTKSGSVDRDKGDWVWQYPIK